MATITNYKELNSFLSANYDNISDSDLKRILAESLGVYIYRKPEHLEKLLERIEAHGQYLETLPPEAEAPLFLITKDDELI
jgi:hypothetical protein